MTFLVTIIVTFFACLIFVPLLLTLSRFVCLFAVVQECEAHIFLLFGKVVSVIDQPGLHFLPLKIGPHALLIRFFGTV
ncbi:MAG: SPFH/Band 7/PHB domain protein, partial [Verrucomicrobiota bacterium]